MLEILLIYSYNIINNYYKYQQSKMSEGNTPEEPATNMPVFPTEGDAAASAEDVSGTPAAAAAADEAGAAVDDSDNAEASPAETASTEPEPEPQPEPEPIPPPSPSPIKKPRSNASRRRKAYDIITMSADKSMDDFIKMVNDRLSSKKYVPIGGVTFDERKNVYIQAISLAHEQPELKNKKSTRRHRFKK